MFWGPPHDIMTSWLSQQLDHLEPGAMAGNAWQAYSLVIRSCVACFVEADADYRCLTPNLTTPHEKPHEKPQVAWNSLTSETPDHLIFTSKSSAKKGTHGSHWTWKLLPPMSARDSHKGSDDGCHVHTDWMRNSMTSRFFSEKNRLSLNNYRGTSWVQNIWFIWFIWFILIPSIFLVMPSESIR
jgi:hypothetical protein